jgi:hypothetical protein
MTTLSPLPTATFTTAGPGVGGPAGSRRCHADLPLETRGPIHDIDLDDPWIRQLLRQCMQDLAGYPAAALPELAFRLLKERLLQGICTATACTATACAGRHLTLAQMNCDPTVRPSL